MTTVITKLEEATRLKRFLEEVYLRAFDGRKILKELGYVPETFEVGTVFGLLPSKKNWGTKEHVRELMLVIFTHDVYYGNRFGGRGSYAILVDTSKGSVCCSPFKTKSSLEITPEELTKMYRYADRLEVIRTPD